MPHHRRNNPYRLRQHEIDPLLTYDGIQNNPLSYIDNDILPIDKNSLCLIELNIDDWNINQTTEQIFLRNSYEHSKTIDRISLKTRLHPLKWFYELIQKEILFIYYSLKKSLLTIVYLFEKQSYVNLYQFYIYYKENKFFKNLFLLDNYQLLLENTEINAINIIDFIYQEIQNETIIHNIDEINLNLIKSYLNNDIITLKDHQIKSINWMIKREKDYSTNIIYKSLYRCYDLNDNTFYIHIINGKLINIHEKDQWNFEEFSLSGGILADEMGLGKTMCVLLTSLLNKAPDSFLLNSISKDENLLQNKKFKTDNPLSSNLPCVCGNIAKVSKKNEHLFNNFISICSQCSRFIHKKCYLQNDDIFLCPYCEQNLIENQELLSTNATLIIVPAAIINQWIEEISKHINYSLNIYMYESIVNKIPVPSRNYLAKQDFIFCSYENLKKDIHHNDNCSKEYHSTRTQIKKYEYLVSPLLRLKFWRLVLDEAQMVDSPNTPAAKMARSLVAHHRWFVTGTPFHRSINDLEGIIQYLFPLNNIPREQISVLLKQKEKLNDLFVLWIIQFLKLVTRRTSRQCLDDLPEQFERVIRLQFSQLERTYYDRIWNECRDEFKKEFQHLWQKRRRERNGGIVPDQPVNWTLQNDIELDMDDVHFLSSTARSCLQTPLIKLRCLCDHPQVGAYGVRHNDPALVHYYNRFHYSTNRNASMRNITNHSLGTNSILNENNQPFTMKDLLDLLTARELEGGEDCLRLSLLNFNGLASLYLIQSQHEITRPIVENNNKNDQYYITKSIEIYERVIEISETYKDPFHADSFQLAHAYYNLSYSLSLLNNDEQSTHKYTVEESLNEFNKIKQRHQTQSQHEMNDAWKNYKEKLLTRKEVENDIKMLLENISECIKPIEYEKVEIHHHVNRERQLPFTTWNGFLFNLVQQFDKLKKIRENLLIYTEDLKRQPNDNDVAQMVSCSKCTLDNDPSNKYICIFCECETVMKSYNCSLQPELYSAQQINDDGGTHLIYYINEILSKASMRSNDSTRQLAKLLRTDWNELLKKLRLENTAARTYSQQLKHLYLSLDEMLQCTSRLEYFIGDPKTRPKKLLNRYRFNPELIEGERNEFEQQAIDYLKKVIQHRRQFHYFQEQQQDYYRSVTTPATNHVSTQQTKCPMCHELFGDDRPDVCFFVCGHFFCQECTLQWKKHEITQRPHRSHIKCPICRREIPIKSLAVLKWKDQNTSTNPSTISPQKHLTDNSSADNMDALRLRRLMETQEHLTIQGRYGTKVDSIVSFILNLIHEDTQQIPIPSITTMNVDLRPPIKILVFSQFIDVLNVLAISLKLNAISYLQFTSTQILQQFRQDPNISVLLMPLGKGANGLNITEAQHVILVEPQLHRSVELQAIARVRRLGQKYNTYVYRFIINDTAEEVVLTNSRTAQTVPENNQPTTTTTTTMAVSDHLPISQTGSFADFELLYEINMAKKIFFKTIPTNNDHELDSFIL